jgi:hypothetical protein
MKVFRTALCAMVVVVLFGQQLCLAQDLSSVWSEWEFSAVPKRGPAGAKALFIYLHAKSVDALSVPIAILFTEMARIAQWDILRINWYLPADDEKLDAIILKRLSDEITSARNAGYKRIVVGGVSRGGWLALSAAALPGIDVVIGLAPGTTILKRPELERTRDLLAQRLAHAKAKRVAAFFFDGDPREAVEERRAVVIRRALQRTRSAYMIVDRPPDLYAHVAAGSGRFVRRYRDCLLQFAQGDDETAGEVHCPPASGYAIGADIGLPASDGPGELPSDASPAIAPYWGRWEGDDDLGTYVSMEAIDAREKVIVFRTGYSNTPWVPEPRTWVRDISFELNEGDGYLRDANPPRSDKLTVLWPKSAAELEFQEVFPTSRGWFFFRRISLRKQGDTKADH